MNQSKSDVEHHENVSKDNSLSKSLHNFAQTGHTDDEDNKIFIFKKEQSAEVERIKLIEKFGNSVKVELSWTEVNDEIVRFKAHDRSHPRSKEIYDELGRISKLAIAFNFIQQSRPSFIQITKNLRVCGDCQNMEREDNQYHFASKRERLLAFFIIFLTVISFFLHLTVFTDILYKNFDSIQNQTDTKIVLDQCCVLTNQSFYQILLKLIICTCPLLLCSELSLIFVCYINHISNDILIITIKWLIFLATILICFWTGTLSDSNQWRGIHGGQIAPEVNSPLYLFQN
ncbi:hypothetical protein I4U23_021709 [Adineta vaga]|nr:hypothetical protein I4U23_021709 [Adineta vaga]